MRATQIRKDINSKKLREEAKGEKVSKVCRRLLGIAHLLEGGSRKEAEVIACISTSNFRIWLARFNEHGIEGLRDKKSTGRPTKLTKMIKEEFKEKVLNGPSEEEGIIRYRLVDLQKFLKEKHEISIGISGVWNLLQELNLTWKTGRQRHPESDEATQEDFKKNFRIRSKLFKKKTQKK
jgi:transposase